MRCTEEQFVQLVEQALSEIPPAFAAHLRDVVVDVEPFPDPEVCAEMGPGTPHYGACWASTSASRGVLSLLNRSRRAQRPWPR